MNAEFQRIPRRDMKAFLSDQCKEIDEKNRMGKTRDLFKKIRDTKGTFHAKMGSIKDRNGMDLTEAEDIKKRWQEYTEELYKKDLHDSVNHDGVITHLEPDILEHEVKWALGSITMNKASGGDGIPVELFQILKDDAVKVLHSIGVFVARELIYCNVIVCIHRNLNLNIGKVEVTVSCHGEFQILHTGHKFHKVHLEQG